MDDPHHLKRFVAAQEGIYPQALAELRRGRKTSHWMWFVFPQLAGLGRSSAAEFYAIRNAGEARAYLEHPVLGLRLMECFETVLAIEGKTASEVFGYPDDLKFRSCATLFAAVSAPESVFARALEKFCGGPDPRTLALLGT